MKRAAIIIMIITLFSKILGLTRDIVLSYFYGASNISDAYLVSLTIPTLIFSFVSSGILTAYIPMLSKIINDSGEDEGSKYTSNLINITLLMTTLITFITILFCEPIIRIFALGFSNETLELAVRFTQITLIGMYFTALVSIFSGFLQVKKKYFAPALIGFPLNIIIIISIFISSQGNYYILALGSLIATISQFILLIPFIKKENFKYSLSINFKDDKIKKTLYIALPAILGSSVNQINTLVDKTIASQLITGGISALNYASRLNQFVQGIFVLSVVTVMYPMISSYANRKEYKNIEKTLQKSINIIILFVIPIIIGTIVFSKPLVDLLFGRGQFDNNAVELTSRALLYYSIGLLGFSLREVFVRVFYSFQDSKIPIINSTLGMLINIILNIFLSRYLGIGGLALATSISSTITAILLYISLRKRIGSFGIIQISSTFVKILVASLIMGFISKMNFIYVSSFLSKNFSLLISIFVGAFSYFIVIYFMKIEEVNTVIKTISKKIQNKISL